MFIEELSEEEGSFEEEESEYEEEEGEEEGEEEEESEEEQDGVSNSCLIINYMMLNLCYLLWHFLKDYFAKFLIRFYWSLFVSKNVMLIIEY